jgi:endonuclease I
MPSAANEPDLELTSDRSEQATYCKQCYSSGGTAYMGLLDVLLEWHAVDPVDNHERRRNTVVYLFQGNRNPFVDHPEWVEDIFGT